jgi:DNA-binding NarL/FixJ family response regulator
MSQDAITPKTIIVVDDHPAICFALKTVLEKDGQFIVHTASDGIQAMAAVKEKQPDLIVLDISLARMDGIETLNRIKHYDAKIKVLILTGQPVELYALRTLKAGADGFVSKDGDLNQIGDICRQLIDGYCCFPSFCLTQLLSESKQQRGSDPLDALSDRELAVMRYLVDGKSNKEIGDLLLLSNKTISTYKSRLFDKLQTTDIQRLKALLEQHPPAGDAC